MGLLMQHQVVLTLYIFIVYAPTLCTVSIMLRSGGFGDPFSLLVLPYYDVSQIEVTSLSIS
jgi:hypothetical protein